MSLNEAEKNKQARLFVALDLPVNVTQEIERIQTYFRSKNLFDATYPQPNQAHVTLKFLGSVDANLIGDIHLALQQLQFEQIEATLGQLDLFLRDSNPQILYAAVNSAGIQELAHKIDDLLSPWFKPEDRTFESHITIARIKTVYNMEALYNQMQQFHVYPLHFVMNYFCLKESVQSNSGSIYTDLGKYQLQRNS